jgi:uncharacterized protein (DUF1778 family)
MQEIGKHVQDFGKRHPHADSPAEHILQACWMDRRRCVAGVLAGGALAPCLRALPRSDHTPFMALMSERSASEVLEPVRETMPSARLVLTAESWNEVVHLVENPPEPTDDLRRLFDDER